LVKKYKDALKKSGDKPYEVSKSIGISKMVINGIGAN